MARRKKMEVTVGELVEEKLQAAGVELGEAYHLAALDMPGLRPGDITIDVSSQGRLFTTPRGRVNRWLSIGYALGPAVGPEGGGYSDSKTALAMIKEAVKNEELHVGSVCLLPFDVDVKEATLRMGAIVPNRLATYKCLRCGETCQASERKVQQYRWGFYCQACYNKDKGEGKLTSERDRELCRRYRMDQPRNIVCFHQRPLSDAAARELATAAVTPIDGGGELMLPRAFVMFRPGQSRVTWEPGDKDYAGKTLVQRCALAEQCPIPIRMAIDAYANLDWEVRPQSRRRAPLKMPGIIGVQLLIDGRTAGWVARESLEMRHTRLGWLRSLPLWNEQQEYRAKEV